MRTALLAAAIASRASGTLQMADIHVDAGGESIPLPKPIRVTKAP